MSSPALPTTSSEFSYNPRAVEIIREALIICAILNDEDQPTSFMLQQGMRTLNSMLKELEATGLHIWTEQEAVLFLQRYQTRYLLGSPPGRPTTDHCADAYSWILSTLAIAAVLGDNAVTVIDPTGMKKGDYFGLVLDTGSAFWTTVRDTPSGAVIPLSNTIPSSASAQNFVFDYTTNIVRPLQVPFARRLLYAMGTMQGGVITPLTPMMSRQEYMDLPQPQNPGTVTQAYYNPARDQGEMYVWNAPSNANNALRFTWYRPILDTTSQNDVMDLPEEWGNALIWNLALELGPRYSIPSERLMMIAKMAAEKLELVRGYDREMQPIYFGRGTSRNRGTR